MSITRRDALKSLGALAGAATASRILPACGADTEYPATIVVMMMENRSFDHFFGSRKLVEGKGSDGLVAGMKNPNRLGVDVGIWPATEDTLCVIDPPHGWDAARVQLAGGACTGFLQAHQDDHNSDTAIEPMQYLLREHVPVSYALADAYTICDRWFCSVLGPTWPNRYYWHTGTSDGITANKLPSSGGITWPSIYDRLNAAGVEWMYYYGDFPVVAADTDLDKTGRIKRFEDFADDAKAGKLAPVVYIDPAFSLNDDHPPHYPMLGQQLIASVYSALASSPQWSKSLMVVTYDENGGFFDHVAPGKTADERAAEGFDQLGFRVPGMLAGPYVKQGYVSSVSYDHTSVLKHIENTFALEPLTMRDAAAVDLSDCLDLDRMAKGQASKPIQLPAVMVDESMLPDRCFNSGSAAAGLIHHDVLAWADANQALIGKYDRRGNLGDYVRSIDAMLRRANAGGIRWGR
ncbi:MAG: alkaline phosphatase family protein [Deltaproteobacteria bacterium]|nr:alkaline phosphatase family protein [Deltaproteobacteria bacterium]